MNVYLTTSRIAVLMTPLYCNGACKHYRKKNYVGAMYINKVLTIINIIVKSIVLPNIQNSA